MEKSMITSTTFDVPGYEAIECLGLVRGISVRVPSNRQSFSASLKVFGGGKSEALIELCETARKEAFEHMVAEAKALGANAVVGVRYDAASVLEFASEVICYGTAVVVQRS
jgi:uncharacterized protein YbjQ (UPF0145 family)